jgi:hypothetical protein
MANKFDIGRFDDCPTKRWLQDQIYTYLSFRMKSNVVMVGSPSLEAQITNGFKIASTPKAEIYLAESNVRRFNEMSRRCRILKDEKVPDGWPENWHYRTKCLYTDVTAYEMAAGLNKPVRFEDLDMCQTMASIQHLVRYRLSLQSEIGGYPARMRKCMLITSSLRRCGLDETLTILLNILENVLDTSVGMWKSANGAKHSRLYRTHGVKEYTPYIADHGRLLKDGLRFYTYGDKSPMFSCIILYI